MSKGICFFGIAYTPDLIVGSDDERIRFSIRANGVYYSTTLSGESVDQLIDELMDMQKRLKPAVKKKETK